MNIVELSVAVNIKKNRLDKFLARETEKLSRSKIQALISSGRVSVNSVPMTDAGYNLKYGDRISFCEETNVSEEPLPEPDPDVKFSILYEDEDLLVIDKPAGIVVHPGAGNFSHTLVNGLISHCGNSLSKENGKYRPGVVHRTDKNTGGILAIAKNDFSHRKLAEQFAIHSVTRKYICFCYGVPVPACGKIETLIARDKRNRLRMAVFENSGKIATTLYRTLKTFSGFAAKAECELKTGRTHQIRVHMSFRGCSLIGDSLYKAKNYFVPKPICEFINKFPRQALHAGLLEFVHPRSKKIMHFESDLPADLRELERILDDFAS
ncbi:MAG: RluA family pseudouridine synthase [Holosporaceae bacterium]|jgi:23S rRNA pseudouridine1911/1915/1917 synthase|nr:RluA family pseudouridine synthase [Holosporaceae bacterium]